MRKVDSDGVERIDARVSLEQQTKARPLLEAVQRNAPDAELIALLRGGAGVAVGNVLGGNDMWINDPSNAVAGPPTVAVDFGTIPPEVVQTSWKMVPMGALCTAKLSGDGRMLANVKDGAARIEISADPTFPNDANYPPTVTTRSEGTSGWLYVKGNVTVYGRYHAQNADGTPKSMEVKWEGQVGAYP